MMFATDKICLGIVWSAALLVLLAFAYLDVPAKLQAASEPVDACPIWRTAGGSIIYRCVDEDTEIVCFSQPPMLICVRP